MSWHAHVHQNSDKVLTRAIALYMLIQSATLLTPEFYHPCPAFQPLRKVQLSNRTQMPVVYYHIITLIIKYVPHKQQPSHCSPCIDY